MARVLGSATARFAVTRLAVAFAITCTVARVVTRRSITTQGAVVALRKERLNVGNDKDRQECGVWSNAGQSNAGHETNPFQSIPVLNLARLRAVDCHSAVYSETSDGCQRCER